MRKLDEVEIVVGAIVGIVFISFLFVLSYEMVDSSERETAIKAGLQQCAEGNLVLWKKECGCKE